MDELLVVRGLPRNVREDEVSQAFGDPWKCALVRDRRGRVFAGLMFDHVSKAEDALRRGGSIRGSRLKAIRPSHDERLSAIRHFDTVGFYAGGRSGHHPPAGYSSPPRGPYDAPFSPPGPFHSPQSPPGPHHSPYSSPPGALGGRGEVRHHSPHHSPQSPPPESSFPTQHHHHQHRGHHHHHNRHNQQPHSSPQSPPPLHSASTYAYLAGEAFVEKAIDMESFHRARVDFQAISSLPTHLFYVLDVQCAVATAEVFIPCQLSLVSFTLRDGELSFKNYFVDPGPLPKSYMALAKYHTNLIHKVPYSSSMAEKNYRLIADTIRDMISSASTPSGVPVVFAKGPHVKNKCVQWLSQKAGGPPFCLVREVEELMEHVCKVTDRSASTLLQYFEDVHVRPGKKCRHHETLEGKGESLECALGRCRALVSLLQKMASDVGL